MSETTKLKLCPFCGETVKPRYLGTQHTTNWFIPYCIGETDSFETEKQLIRAWNKRITPKPYTPVHLKKCPYPKSLNPLDKCICPHIINNRGEQ